MILLYLLNFYCKFFGWLIIRSNFVFSFLFFFLCSDFSQQILGMVTRISLRSETVYPSILTWFGNRKGRNLWKDYLFSCIGQGHLVGLEEKALDLFSKKRYKTLFYLKYWQVWKKNLKLFLPALPDLPAEASKHRNMYQKSAWRCNFVRSILCYFHL